MCVLSEQFEKVEQFSITSPENDDSWRMQEEMLGNCKDFYKSLGVLLLWALCTHRCQVKLHDCGLWSAS